MRQGKRCMINNLNCFSIGRISSRGSIITLWGSIQTEWVQKRWMSLTTVHFTLVESRKLQIRLMRVRLTRNSLPGWPDADVAAGKKTGDSASGFYLRCTGCGTCRAWWEPGREPPRNPSARLWPSEPQLGTARTGDPNPGRHAQQQTIQIHKNTDSEWVIYEWINERKPFMDHGFTVRNKNRFQPCRTFFKAGDRDNGINFIIVLLRQSLGSFPNIRNIL